MPSTEGQQTTISQPGLGVLLMRGLVLGLLVGFLVNLAFSYVILLTDKTSFHLIFQPVSSWQDIFDTIRSAAQFLMGGMAFSIFTAFFIIPVGILAGGFNGVLFRWIGTHPIFRILSGAVIGFGVGLFLARLYIMPGQLSQNSQTEDMVVLLASITLGTLGGFLHSQLLERWR